MPLSKEEQDQLDALTKKASEPEPEKNGGGRSENISVTIDFSDEKAVERAIKHGYITRAEAEEIVEGEEEESEEGGTKKRRVRFE